MADKVVHAQVYGTVQGVFFRDYTRRKAEELGLTGWVRNRTDGSVETLFGGDQAGVESMISWLHQGSPSAVVDQVVAREVSPDRSLTGFQILY